MSWRLLWARPIARPDDAAAFVEALGFCAWGPVPGLDFPNLAEAMGHTRGSVMDQTWSWKDDLHFAHRVHYGKIVRGQPTFVAPDYLPDFVAALGDERDVERQYRDGRITRETHALYEFLRDNPRQPSRELKSGARIGGSSSAPLDRALIDLQRRFLICKVDLSGRTRGLYSYVWDLFDRFWPGQADEARGTPQRLARERIRDRLADFGLDPSPALEEKLLLWR